MSEYQYYEFRAIDKPLDPAAQKQVASLSSRVHPHPTRAVFTYSYSDFPRNPIEIVERYYDAFFYITNWGSVQLAFRLPRDVVDVPALRAYCIDDAVVLHEHDKYVVVEWRRDSEGGFDHWIEGEGTLDSLLALRAALLAQDYRALYLGWLVGVEDGWDIEDDLPEPPIPAGLDTLTPALQEFVDTFWLDDRLIKVAAQASAHEKRRGPRWQDAVAQLDAAEQQAWLLRLAKGEALLATRFQQHLRTLLPRSRPSARGRRTVGSLLTQRDALVAGEKKKAQARAEAQRIKRMEALALKEADTWRWVEQLIEQKNGRAYDEALGQLRQLQALANHRGTQAEFAARVSDLRTRYTRRPALLRRLDKL